MYLNAGHVLVLLTSIFLFLRSHSNLTRLRLTEKNTLPNNLLTNPPSYHRSMNVLNPAARFKDQAVVHSPLSAALEQARVNFKTIGQ